METMQDKHDQLIREKISSLNTLPEGYTPSLESKWELLQQATRPQPKTHRLWYYRFAAAASLLLVLGMAFILNRLHKPAVVQYPTADALPQAQLPPVTTPAPETTAQPVLAEDSKVSKSQASKAAWATSNRPNPLQNHTTQQHAQVSEPTLAVETEPELPAQPDMQLAQNHLQQKPEQAKAASKRRTRMVEIDFADTPAPQQYARQETEYTFKFKLFPHHSTEQQHVQHNRMLKVQHSF